MRWNLLGTCHVLLCTLMFLGIHRFALCSPQRDLLFGTQIAFTSDMRKIVTVFIFTFLFATPVMADPVVLPWQVVEEKTVGALQVVEAPPAVPAARFFPISPRAMMKPITRNPYSINAVRPPAARPVAPQNKTALAPSEAQARAILSLYSQN